MAISGAAIIKGNAISREGNKTSRALPFLALPDIFFKKPTAVCNLATDIYTDICWYCGTPTAVELMTASNLLHLTLFLHAICTYGFSLLLERALENANGSLCLMAHNAYVSQKP